MPRRYTEAQRKSALKWDAKNLDRLSLALPKGMKERIQTASEKTEESVNGYIKAAIEKRLGAEE